MFQDGGQTKVKDNPLNENFAKKGFQELWKRINHKYAYTVNFKSEELIAKAIAHIDDKLYVSELRYTTSVGRQKPDMNEYDIDRSDSFGTAKTRTKTLQHHGSSQISYDLVDKIAEGTVLTRKTVVVILSGIRLDKLSMFRNNPEEFISKVIRLIKEQKTTRIVEHISYNRVDDEYDSDIFTAEKTHKALIRRFELKKHFRIMCLLIVLRKRVLSVVLQKIWILHRKFVYMLNCQRAPISPLQSVSILLTGPLLSTKEA